MSSSAVPLSQLRQLLADRFPAVARPDSGQWRTGIPAIDEAVGGLPRRGLTELVCTGPSTGSELCIAQLLALTRPQAVRVALIDATDNFDPASIPAAELEHLVWVRCRSLPEAMSAGDLLAREASLDLVILDLTGSELPALRRIAASTWYRLQRAVEQTNLVFLALTPARLVASAQLRLQLDQSRPLSHQDAPRPQLVANFAVHLQLQRQAARQA